MLTLQDVDMLLAMARYCHLNDAKVDRSRRPASEIRWHAGPLAGTGGRRVSLRSRIHLGDPQPAKWLWKLLVTLKSIGIPDCGPKQKHRCRRILRYALLRLFLRRDRHPSQPATRPSACRQT